MKYIPRTYATNLKLIVLSVCLFAASPYVNQARADSNPPIGDTEQKQICKDEICFPNSVEIAGTKLTLRGISLFTYWGFRVYTGAFYAPPEVRTVNQALSDVPKYLVLHYHRGLEAQNFVDNSEYILKQNPDINMQELRPELQKLYKSYGDVKEGDKYALQYIPGQGTTLTLNGKPQGSFPGTDFQKAYFGIWLSNYSVGKDFTRKLLDGKS